MLHTTPCSLVGVPSSDPMPWPGTWDRYRATHTNHSIFADYPRRNCNQTQHQGGLPTAMRCGVAGCALRMQPTSMSLVVPSCPGAAVHSDAVSRNVHQPSMLPRGSAGRAGAPRHILLPAACCLRQRLAWPLRCTRVSPAVWLAQWSSMQVPPRRPTLPGVVRQRQPMPFARHANCCCRGRRHWLAVTCRNTAAPTARRTPRR